MTEPEADAREAVFLSPAKFTGIRASFTFDKASGSWTATLDNSNDDASALTASQGVDDALTATSADGLSSQMINNTITDPNGAVAISGEAFGAMSGQDPPPIQTKPSP
ncbi:MAG: hypothetical protein GY859_06305 [Desulfobacterales bacterium]|nr:hypothetical protein [Desulfobacterales bacterium]